jgi:hypothetical protein
MSQISKKRSTVSEISLTDVNTNSTVVRKCLAGMSRGKKCLFTNIFSTPHILLSEHKSDSDLYELCDNCKVLKFCYLMHMHTHARTHTEYRWVQCNKTDFMLCWPCILDMNNNQLDVLFVFTLLSYHTSTCFGRISSPSSGSRMYICGKWYLLCFWVDSQRA